MKIKGNMDNAWRSPNYLRDSNVSPKLKTMEEQGVGARSLAYNIIEG
jgi:hypothetical protein